MNWSTFFFCILNFRDTLSSFPSLIVFRWRIGSWNTALSQVMNNSREATPKRKLAIGSEKETLFPVSNCSSFQHAQEKARGRGFALFYFFNKGSEDFTKLSSKLPFYSLFATLISILSFHPMLTHLKYYSRIYYLKLTTQLWFPE